MACSRWKPYNQNDVTYKLADYKFPALSSTYALMVENYHSLLDDLAVIASHKCTVIEYM